MARDVLRVDNVSAETKEALQALALARFGQANASLMVRHLISECLSTEQGAAPVSSLALNGPRKVIELRLPQAVLTALEEQAEKRLSSRNYYICSLVYRHFGLDQLQGDEIEVLRRSNYELSKIGTNINQIAKAFNLLVAAAGGGKTPEIGKKLAALRSEIKQHTARVLRVLDAKTTQWEVKQGRPQAKRERNDGKQSKSKQHKI